MLTSPSRTTLGTDLASPRRARRFLDQVHCAEHGTEVLATGQLLVTELVTNAVRYADPPIVLEVECRATGGLCVRVRDGGPPALAARSGDRDDHGGRGLMIVDALSDDWGVERAGSGGSVAGKVVWFCLRVA